VSNQKQFMKARIASQKPEEVAIERALSNGRSKSRRGTQQRVATDVLTQNNQNIMVVLNDMHIMQGKHS
jgi:hypothetical protein